jgi:hypothetical protein
MVDSSRSSAATKTTLGWATVAMPSVADLIFVALLLVLLFTPLSVRLLGDAGIGWHIRTGQEILATHSIPRVDLFSTSTGGRPWFAWEWLYDLVVGRLDSAYGLNGVVWFNATVIAAVFAWMFRLLIRRGVNVAIALLLTLLAMSASTIHFLARPHVLSWLFALAWFWILDASEADCYDVGGHTKNRLWLLPPLMLVWVNVHGGFVLGFVLLAIFWLGAVWNWYKGKGSWIEESLQRIAAGKRIRSLGLVSLLSIAASFVNPYGWSLHAHVYSYLSNRFLMDHVDEFQSPNFHGVAQKCFAVLLLVSIAVVAIRGRRLRLSEGLTVLFAVYAGLYASRNIPVSSILLVMVVGRLICGEEGGDSNPPGSRNRASFVRRMTDIESGLRGHVWCLIAVVATLLIAAHGGTVGSSVVMDAHFGAARMPVEAVNYLEQQGTTGPILSPDYWGGYLIYRLYPKTQVVVDDRHDLYGEKFLKSYLKMIHGELGWDEFLSEHKAVCVLFPRESALASLLAESAQWRPVYADAAAIVFVRRSEPSKP